MSTTFKNVKNRATTTLNDSGGISDVDTTVIVTDGSVFPAAEFWATIEDEIVLVTTIVTNTLTITRAQQSTTGVAHADGLTIALHVTEQDVIDLQTAIGSLEVSISNVDDVTITSIAANEILKWSGSAWINNTLAEAGIQAAGAVLKTGDTMTGDLILTDNDAIALGAGSDSRIYYDNTDTFWDLRAAGTGDLMIALAAGFPSPDAGTVHIWKGDAGSVDAIAQSVLTLESSVGTDLSLLGPTNVAHGINFGTPDANNDGRISYQGSGSSPADTMMHFTNGIVRLYESANTFEFQEATTISTTAGDLTLNPTGNVALGTNLITGLGDPVSDQDAVTKIYVDTATTSFDIDYFFNNTPSDVGGIYFDMTSAALGGAETTDLETAGLTASTNDQALVNFLTNETGGLGILDIPAGTFEVHFHAERTGGNSDTNIYAAIYKRASGGAETLIATSQISGLVTSKTDFSLFAHTSADVDLLATDRIVVKFFANIGSGSGSTVEIYVEGTTVARLAFPTTSEILNQIFVRQDGSKPLTANWDVGAFTITGTQFISDIAGGTPPFVVTSSTEVTNLKSATVGTIAGLAPDTATTQATQPNIATCDALTSIQTLTVTLADAGADAILGWDDTASAYENLTQAEVLAIIGDASLTAKGVIEIATGTETNTGTDATRAVSPDGLDDWTGSAQITTLGTITNGVWTGTDINVADGGTGKGTTTAYAVQCGGTTSTAAHQSIAGVGTADQVLTSNGPSALPTFQDVGGAVAMFGGDGADGALDTSGGTVDIDLGSAAVVEKNYTSINVVTNNLTFSNPHSGGSVVILRSQGNVTISATITADNFGSAGGVTPPNQDTGGLPGNDHDAILDSTEHGGGGGTYNGAGGIGGLVFDTTTTNAMQTPYTTATSYLYKRILTLLPGAGGGSGAEARSGGVSQGGPGGKGGGALLIECAGAWNFTGTITVGGLVGGNASPGESGGGGGGGGGMLVALYNTLTTSSGTATIVGGSGGSPSGAKNAGGGGGGTVANAGSDGQTIAGGGNGGTGGSGASLIAKNTWFA